MVLDFQPDLDVSFGGGLQHELRQQRIKPDPLPLSRDAAGVLRRRKRFGNQIRNPGQRSLEYICGAAIDSGLASANEIEGH